MEERQTVDVAVIGGGPAGLMAAEILLEEGFRVHLYDSMPALARKLMVAGQTNLGLTRDEPLDELLHHYGEQATRLRPALESFPPDKLRQWALDLGVETFVGTTSQVFPTEMTADTLLANWLDRLLKQGMVIHTRHRWLGWGSDGALLFEGPETARQVEARATVLALGGASWPQLGSTGAWVSLLRQQDIEVIDLQPANCGFESTITAHFSQTFSGQPIKNVVLTIDGEGEDSFSRRGELVVTAVGFEGSLLYQCGPLLRKRLKEGKEVVVHLDLCPDRSLAQLIERLSLPKGKRSISSHLRKTVAIDGVKAGLLNEFGDRSEFSDPEKLAGWLKQLPVPLTGPRPLTEAISSAGGVCFSAMDDHYMLHKMPGTFCCGEMLDWEAPTGGYLLSACFATGRAAGRGAALWLREK